METTPRTAALRRGEAREAAWGAPLGEASPLHLARHWMRAGAPRHTAQLRFEPPLTLSCILGVNGEDSRLVYHSVREARPVCSDVAAVDVIHVELQGTP